MDVFDDDGALVGAIALSERQQQLLELEGAIVVTYHTPQTLRHLLGAHSATFELGKNAAGELVVHASQVAAFKRFVDLQADIKRARETNAKSSGATR